MTSGSDFLSWNKRLRRPAALGQHRSWRKLDLPSDRLVVLCNDFNEKDRMWIPEKPTLDNSFDLNPLIHLERSCLRMMGQGSRSTCREDHSR